jgi:hypothetical protein
MSHSFHDPELVKALLIEFLEGEYTVTQLQATLQGGLTVHLDLAPGQREIHGDVLGLDLDIPVSARHVRHMLERYIDGTVSQMELSNWAAFLFCGLFVPEGDTEDEQWEAGDGPVWDILQRLVTPDIFDGLDTIVAKSYLEMLK